MVWSGAVLVPLLVLLALLKNLSYLLQLPRQPSGLYHSDKRKDKLSLLLWSSDIPHVIWLSPCVFPPIYLDVTLELSVQSLILHWLKKFLIYLIPFSAVCPPPFLLSTICLLLV